MQTVAQRTTKIQHYAYYGDDWGIATLVSGGYAFLMDGATGVKLVSYRDPNLMLLGRCDLVAAADLADGDRVVRCSRTLV